MARRPKRGVSRYGPGRISRSWAESGRRAERKTDDFPRSDDLLGPRRSFYSEVTDEIRPEFDQRKWLFSAMVARARFNAERSRTLAAASERATEARRRAVRQDLEDTRKRIVCERRKRRREALFGLHRVGRGSGRSYKQRVFTQDSLIHC